MSKNEHLSLGTHRVELDELSIPGGRLLLFFNVLNKDFAFQKRKNSRLVSVVRFLYQHYPIYVHGMECGDSAH